MKIATNFGILNKKHHPAYRGIDNRPEYARAACDASLARLRTNCIDLYYVHRVDPSAPIEGTVQVLAQLVSEGQGAPYRPIQRVGGNAAPSSPTDPGDGIVPRALTTGIGRPS